MFLMGNISNPIFIHSAFVGQELENISNLTLFHPPVNMLAGDILIAHFATRTSSHTPVVTAGWTMLHNDVDTGNFWKQAVQYKVCTGAEVPSSTISCSFTTGLNSVKCGNVYLLRTVANSEGWGFLGNNNNTLLHADIPIVNVGTLAVSFYSWVLDTPDSVMTGANRKWVRPYGRQGMNGPVTGLSLFTNMQYAYVGPITTVTGGSSSLTNLSMNRTFAFY